MMNAVFGSNTTDYKSTWLCESCNHEYLHENDSIFFFWNSKFLDFLHKHPPMSTETINDVMVGLPILILLIPEITKVKSEFFFRFFVNNKTRKAQKVGEML